MIQLVCDILSQEKFVQFLLVITFLLNSSMCSNKNNNKKPKKKKHQKSTSSSFSQSTSKVSKKMSKRTKKWKKHSKPKHPGYEKPIEATEDTNTQYQIDNFCDAEDF
ncbi:unnamed protein product [Caenorhabditis angaria]|uniref:Uncharacterized protein n=1 Tax=Caenorhabditis angaria TaxID=860376 RepID=A0A9P1IAU5_9PELO|nr:unnamed protein product [Caenorhabditis angaria]